MFDVCKHCGYSSLAHKGTIYSSSLQQAAAHRDIQMCFGKEGYMRYLADNPCDNYKRDNLLYLESIVTNNG